MQSEDLFSLVLSVALLGFAGAIAILVRNSGFGAFRITLLLFCMFTPVRAIFLATGFDTMFPDHLAEDVSHVLPVALLLAFLWLLVLVASFVACRRAGRVLSVVFPLAPGPERIPRLHLVNMLLMAFCILTTVYVAGKAGGVLAMPSFLKQERQGAGLYALRQFGSLGLFTSGACLLYGFRQKRFSVLNFVLCLVFAGATFLWGGREVIAALMLFLIAGVWLYSSLSRFAIASIGALAVLLLVSLSYWRAEMISDALVENQQVSLVRRVSVSMHFVRLDAMLLSYNHFQDQGKFRGGEDFLNGFIEAVPRLLWNRKPEVSKFGHALRLEFDEKSKNGWPVDTFAIWYINFGIWGVVFGAFLSGAILSAIEYKYQDLLVNPLSLAASVILSIEVFQGGVTAGWPSAFVLWIVPVCLVFLLLGHVKIPSLQMRLRLAR